MKKILGFLFLMLISFAGFSQTVTNEGSKSTRIRILGSMSWDSAAYIPLRDTNWKPTIRTAFTVRPADSIPYFYNGRKWSPIGGNVYTGGWGVAISGNTIRVDTSINNGVTSNKRLQKIIDSLTSHVDTIALYRIPGIDSIYFVWGNDLMTIKDSTGISYTLKDEGIPFTGVSNINFLGAGVTATQVGNQINVTIPGIIDSLGVVTDHYTTDVTMAAGVLSTQRNGLSTINTNINTGNVPESGPLYFTGSRARQTQSALPPLIYDSATGIHSIQAAGPGQSGYVLQADWNYFNNKQQPLRWQNSGSNITSVGGANYINFLGSNTATVRGDTVDIKGTVLQANNAITKTVDTFALGGQLTSPNTKIIPNGNIFGVATNNDADSLGKIQLYAGSTPWPGTTSRYSYLKMDNARLDLNHVDSNYISMFRIGRSGFAFRAGTYGNGLHRIDSFNLRPNGGIGNAMRPDDWTMILQQYKVILPAATRLYIGVNSTTNSGVGGDGTATFPDIGNGKLQLNDFLPLNDSSIAVPNTQWVKRQLYTSSGADAITAGNGLTKTGNNITFGGTLSANTDIAFNNKTLAFGNASNTYGLVNSSFTGQFGNIGDFGYDPYVTYSFSKDSIKFEQVKQSLTTRFDLKYQIAGISLNASAPVTLDDYDFHVNPTQSVFKHKKVLINPAWNGSSFTDNTSWLQINELLPLSDSTLSVPNTKWIKQMLAAGGYGGGGGGGADGNNYPNSFTSVNGVMTIGRVGLSDLTANTSYADNSISLSKLVNLNARRLVGRNSSSAGAPQEIKMGVGVDIVNDTLKNTGVTSLSAEVGSVGTSIFTTLTGAAKYRGLVADTGISITVPSGYDVVVKNTAPDKVVTLTPSGIVTVSGTYPNFTIGATVTGSVFTETTTVGVATLWAAARDATLGHSLNTILRVGNTTDNSQRTFTMMDVFYITSANFSINSWIQVGQITNSAYKPSNIVQVRGSTRVDATQYISTGGVAFVGENAYSDMNIKITPDGKVYVYCTGVTQYATLSGTNMVIIPISVTYFIPTGT